jgi:DnaJ-class molecular chaperone
MFAHMFHVPRVHVVTVQLDLKDIVEGAHVEACMQIKQKCTKCTGVAATKKASCGTCGGSGQRVVRLMDMELITVCTDCNGVGTSLKTDCEYCDGQGSIMVDEIYNVYIPPGCIPGDIIRTENEQCMVKVAHNLPEHIRIVKKDVFITEFVTIRDILSGFTRRIQLYDKRVIKITAKLPMNPEEPYVSQASGIPGGKIKIEWKVIWDMVPIIRAAPAIRKALTKKESS